MIGDLEEFKEAESCSGLNAVRKWGGGVVTLRLGNLMNLI